MKVVTILIMLSMLAVLGCNPQPGPNESSTMDQNQNVAPAEGVTTYEVGTWLTNLDMAKQVAATLKRPILINFTGSDWCSWCIKLSNEVFTKAEFIDYAKQNLVMLKLDFPMKKKLPAEEQKLNDTIRDQYEVQGYPTIVLTDALGKEINRTGYQAGGPQKYILHLQDLLGEYQPKPEANTESN